MKVGEDLFVAFEEDGETLFEGWIGLLI